MRRPLLLVTAAAGTLVALATAVEARSTIELAWPVKDVFPIAVRFVRVDRGCKITDKDPDSGYLLFECESEGKKKPGSLELIGVESAGRGAARAQVTLTDEPRYVELRFLELLERKVRDERGSAPPPTRPQAPPPAPPDAGR